MSFLKPLVSSEKEKNIKPSKIGYLIPFIPSQQWNVSITTVFCGEIEQAKVCSSMVVFNQCAAKIFET